MHLPRSKAEGAVEITGDNDFKAHRAQDADVVVLKTSHALCTIQEIGTPVGLARPTEVGSWVWIFIPASCYT